MISLDGIIIRGFLKHKDTKQPLKWDTFIASKSGRQRPLPPIPQKSSEGGSSSTFVTESNHQLKPNSIPSTKDSQQPIDKNLLKGKPIIFVGGGPGLNCH